MMRSIRKFILSLLNWIQDLEQNRLYSFISVLKIPLDWISLRLEYFFNERFEMFQIIDFEQVGEWYFDHKKFASVYLERFDKESKSNDEIDKELYSQLVKLDKRLGRKASDQLYEFILQTTRSDIIKDIVKVGSFPRMKNLKLFKIIDFDEVNENKRVKKANYIGYAHFYLSQCHKDSKSDDEIVKEFYAKLVEMDKRLGTPPSEQLYNCLENTFRSDIIKV